MQAATMAAHSGKATRIARRRNSSAGKDAGAKVLILGVIILDVIDLRGRLYWRPDRMIWARASMP